MANMHFPRAIRKGTSLPLTQNSRNHEESKLGLRSTVRMVIKFWNSDEALFKKFQAIYWRQTKIYSVKGSHFKVFVTEENITLFNYWNSAGGRKGCVRLWHKVEKCTHLCSAIVSLSLIHSYTSHYRLSILCWFQGLDFKWVLFVPRASGRCVYKISVCFSLETDVETGVKTYHPWLTCQPDQKCFIMTCVKSPATSAANNTEQ